MNNFLRQIVYYSTYTFFLWLCYLITISFVSFFHFLLDHPIEVIQDGVFHRGWVIAIFCKILVVTTFLYFVSLRNRLRKPIRSLFIKGFLNPGSEVYVLIIFLNLFFIFLGKPVFQDAYSFNLSSLVLSFFGINIYYISNILLLDLLQRTYPIDKRYQEIIISFFYIFIFVFVESEIFNLSGMSTHFLIFNFTICLMLQRRHQLNWLSPLAYSFLLIAPMTSFIGVDPIWGAQFSPFRLSSQPLFIEFVAILILSLSYLFFRGKGFSITSR